MPITRGRSSPLNLKIGVFAALSVVWFPLERNRTSQFSGGSGCLVICCPRSDASSRSLSMRSCMPAPFSVLASGTVKKSSAGPSERASTDRIV